MLLWSAAIACAGAGVIEWIRHGLAAIERNRADERGLERVRDRLRAIEESLGAGLAPEPGSWTSLLGLPAPWGRLAHDSLVEIRTQGGSILPTARRLRELAAAHGESLRDARVKTAQARSQAVFAAFCAPGAAIFLWSSLPGVAEAGKLWWGAAGLATGLSCLATAWISRMADAARWGGLPPDRRPSLAAALCAGERFLALLRSGLPADLAWNRATEFVAPWAPALAVAWGSLGSPRDDKGPPIDRALAGFGRALRSAAAMSIMEGKPCGERAEGALQALRGETRACIDQEVALLGTRALKPLFLLVAPSLLGLVAAGIALAAGRAFEG